MSGAKAERKEVIAVYAVKMNMDLDNPQEVMTMDESKKQKLRDIFWDMNEISHNITTKTTKSSSGSGTSATETTTTTKTLHITVTHKTADEMASQYHFSREQIDSMRELLDAKYNSLWSSVLHGILSRFLL
jgi:arginine decarboxylase-like protein